MGRCVFLGGRLEKFPCGMGHGRPFILGACADGWEPREPASLWVSAQTKCAEVGCASQRTLAVAFIVLGESPMTPMTPARFELGGPGKWLAVVYKKKGVAVIAPDALFVFDGTY